MDSIYHQDLLSSFFQEHNISSNLNDTFISGDTERELFDVNFNKEIDVDFYTNFENSENVFNFMDLEENFSNDSDEHFQSCEQNITVSEDLLSNSNCQNEFINIEDLSPVPSDDSNCSSGSNSPIPVTISPQSWNSQDAMETESIQMDSIANVIQPSSQIKKIYIIKSVSDGKVKKMKCQPSSERMCDLISTPVSPMYDYTNPDNTMNSPISLNIVSRDMDDNDWSISDEEKSLLIKEGITLSNGHALSKVEKKALKLVRRKIRNKISAKVSRQRKTLYVEGLQKRLEEFSEQNSQLQEKLDDLKEENDSLLKQFKLFNEILNGKFPFQLCACLIVLLVSLAFLVTPNPSSLKSKSQKSSNSSINSSKSLNKSISVKRTFSSTSLLPNIAPKPKVVYRSIIDPRIFQNLKK